MSVLRRGSFVATTFAVACFASACSGGGGGGGSPSPTPPPPVVVTRTFPANVAVAAGGGTAWDIIGVKTTLTGQFQNAGGNSYDTLRVDVTFSQNVENALPLPGQPLSGLNQLGISIGLDTDGNPNTGTFKTCNLSSPLTPFEYSTDQGNDPSRLSDGNYSIIGPGGSPIYSGSPNPPSEAQTSADGSIVSQTFLLTAIGVHSGSAVPRIGVGVVAVNSYRSVYTDCVPSGSSGVEFFSDGS